MKKTYFLFVQVAASEALENFEKYYLPYIRTINESRNHFIKDLVEEGINAFNGGGGNFACVQVPKVPVSKVCEVLEKQTIYVRDISGRFPGHFRVTICVEMSRVRDAIVEAFRSLELF